MNIGIESEGEGRTEERKYVCSRTSIMATHAYTNNPDSHLGKEIDI